MQPRGVLFDVDDTIFDYSSSEKSGLLAHLKAEGRLGRFPSPEAAAAQWHAVMNEEYGRFLAGELTFTEQKLTRTRRFLAFAMSDDEAAAWFAGYVAHRNAAWSAFADAEPTLRKLSTSYRLGVVSNSSLAHQQDKLDRIGLSGFFEARVVCSAEHGCAKPDPSIFLAGCAALELEPGEVAYVGDKYDLDAVGARDAGLRAFWLDRPGLAAERTVEDGVQVIRSLDELSGALAG